MTQADVHGVYENTSITKNIGWLIIQHAALSRTLLTRSYWKNILIFSPVNILSLGDAMNYSQRPIRKLFRGSSLMPDRIFTLNTQIQEIYLEK